MKTDLLYLIANFNRLTGEEWDKLDKHAIDGLIGYDPLTEEIIKDNVADWMIEWVKIKAELLRLEEN